MKWVLSSSSDRVALDIVDGVGRFDVGPHYSRRTPGSKTFTGVGREVVLVTECGRAVWAVVLQKTPAKRGTGASRGRSGSADLNVRWLWRNNMFRNLGAGLSSDLIRSAVLSTRYHWAQRYGDLPDLQIRTEIKISAVRSVNPGYCYLMAGWTKGKTVRGKLYLHEPRL